MNITLKQNGHVINLDLPSDDAGNLITIIGNWQRNPNVTAIINEPFAFQGKVEAEPPEPVAEVKPQTEIPIYELQVCGEEEGKVSKDNGVNAANLLMTLTPLAFEKAKNVFDNPWNFIVGEFTKEYALEIIKEFNSYGYWANATPVGNTWPEPNDWITPNNYDEWHESE